MSSSSLFRCAAFFSVALTSAASAAGQSQVYVVKQGCRLFNSGNVCFGPFIHLINTVTGNTLASFPVGSSGDSISSLRLSSDGRLLFFTTGFRSTDFRESGLAIIDTRTRRYVALIPVGSGADDVAILPDGTRAYVVNGRDNSVSVVDLTSFAVVGRIAVQSAPQRIVVSPDGNSLYVTNNGWGTVSKISTATNTVVTHIAVGMDPMGLDISPDGSRLFVGNSASDSVSVIDAGNDSVLRTLAVRTESGSSHWMEVSAQSATRVYVAPGEGPVQLLNAADGAVVGSVPDIRFARFAKDASGTPTFVASENLKLASMDGTSAPTIASAGSDIRAAAVVTDHCAFEATATPRVLGPAGGSGTITIPTPAGCSWTIDPSGVSGLSIAGALAGTGPATRAFTVPSTSIPRLGEVSIQRQAIVIEQTIPRMNVELPSGAVLREPVTITGWAFDQNASSSAFDVGVDQVHVWAYPAGGGAPILVDVARRAINYGHARSDIAAIYGFKYEFSGFTIVVKDLPAGSYTLAFFARSTRSNTFSNVQTVDVTVQQPGVQIAIDRPAAGVVSGTFSVAGWAVDSSTATGPGVDAVHVWAYPSSGASPVFVGAAVYGGARPDVAAYSGSSFTNCGYGLSASLSPGGYTLVVFARSVATKQFASQTVRITVQ